MLRRNGYVKVLDFGLAKLTNESPTPDVKPEAPTMTRVVKTHPGVAMGTASYMSPEQARRALGYLESRNTDWWAGRLPFEGATTSDVIATILHREPPSLLLYRSDIPADVCRNGRVVSDYYHSSCGFFHESSCEFARSIVTQSS